MATNAGDIFSSAKINYARLGHASQSLIPKLLQQLLLFYEPTNKIQKDCSSNSYLNAKLNFTEKNNIDKAKTEGYVNFDIPLIYKLLRNLKLIPPPTRGWEPQGGPMITETTIGDDLERFRKSRNDILHRGNTNVSDQQLTEYFTQFKEIAQRLELVLNKKNNELFSEFENLETDCIDDGSEQILASLAKLATEKSKYSISISVNISNAESTDSRTLIKKPLQDVCCVEGEIACLSCEIIKDETAVTWYKDDVEIFPSTDIILEMHGKIHELLISKTEMKDGGRYSIKVKQSTSEAKLTVKALISNHLVDTTCLEGSTIVLSCEVSVEDISGIWYKDDSIVVQSNQIHPTVNSRIHQLNIFQSEIKDGGRYVFKIRDKISSAILTVKAVITKHLENVTCIEDQSLSLVCELAEKDISVTWLKDEKVIEASKNIVPEIHSNAHILKLKKLSKNDGGKYALMARGKKTEAVVLVKAKSTIPDQILKMDEKDKEMYLEIIKSGTERRYYIRLMIVGENGVGKTCLMRRLFGEDIDDVTSTDGIDVVIRKCKIRISDGKWILIEEDTVEQDRNVRMKRALTDKDSILPEEKRRDNRAEPLLEDVPMETTVTSFGNVKSEEIKNVTESKDIYTGKVMDQKNDVDTQFTNKLKESRAESVPLHTDKDFTLKSEKRVEILDILPDVMNVELPKEFFADCAVWDFAGQKEFYATHQTFLTNSAIYLLTTDLSKDLSSQRQTNIYNVDPGEVGCYIDFWLDTIHCYATTESPDQSVDEPTLDKLEPPIIIACTGTDKIEGELNERKTLFEKQLNAILNKQSKRKRKHITGIQYLSNKEPLHNDFVELQSTIFQTATKMSSWGKELPLRWIRLETALDGERDAGSNILPFNLVVKLAEDSSLPRSANEEIILFLRYQHECGHVIFYEDLPDYIILNPRWLIDAFKCLVSAHQFQGTLLHLDDWKELEETGRLTNKLISKLFEKVPKLKFMENKKHLLDVLEKFDIIVKPKDIENMTYYMPCMIESSSFKEIYKKFGVPHRTSWLLLEFEFLPPAFFNHILVGYIRDFKVSTESTENGERLSLYRGIGVFDIDKSGCRKLVICAAKNVIAIQIWIYDDVLDSTFHYIQHTLTNMVDMLSERYQICCKYKVKLKCSESDYQKAEGRFEYCYKDDKMKTYFCPEHQRVHECLDVFKYWFSDKVDGLVIKEEEQERAAGTALLDDNASPFKQPRVRHEDHIMAGRNDPNKQALSKNRPKIIQHLGNPDDVAAYLYGIGLFTDEMQAAVLQEPEKEQKNRKILDILNYRGKNAAKALYDAFLETSNEDLAELLAPYVKQIQSEDKKTSPTIWPPSGEEQKRMALDGVKRITDLKSPHYIHYYTSSTVYKMRNRIRGKVFIINNETFEKKAKLSVREKKGSDVENLKSIFTQLQFDVIIAKNQTRQDMIDFLKNERDKVNWNDMECVVLIIISHGATDGIYGTDGELTKLKDMTDIFDSSQCPGLNEKPRLVFVQACRGANTESGSTGHGIQATDGDDQKDKVVDPMKDMTLTEKGGEDMLDAVPRKETEVTEKTVHSAADFLIAYATPEGTPAYRNIEVGSWFLNAIVWTFKYHAHKEEISQLLLMVNNLVSQGRTTSGHMTVSEVKSTLRKQFFFFPGVYDNPPKLVDS